MIKIDLHYWYPEKNENKKNKNKIFFLKQVVIFEDGPKNCGQAFERSLKVRVRTALDFKVSCFIVLCRYVTLI